MKISRYNQIDIAKAIGKDRSIISGELKKNGDLRNGEYIYILTPFRYLNTDLDAFISVLSVYCGSFNFHSFFL